MEEKKKIIRLAQKCKAHKWDQWQLQQQRLTLRNLFISISYSFFLWKNKQNQRNIKHFRKHLMNCIFYDWWQIPSSPVHSVSGSRPSQPVSAASTAGCTSPYALCWVRPSCSTSAPHRTLSNRFCRRMLTVHYNKRNHFACIMQSRRCCDSRWRFVRSAVRFILQVPLGLGQGGLHDIVLRHV